jgi:4-amino-4-deoxy-L-arabinose transferase-like glycosyltransferase
VRSRGRSTTALAAVTWVALAVRLTVLGTASTLSPSAVMTPDSYGYDLLARTLLHRGRFASGPLGAAQTRRTPGFPLLIAAVYGAAGRDDPRLVVLLGVVVSALTVGIASRIADRLWGTRAALVAGGLLAVDPASINAARFLLTETPFTALVALGAWAAGRLVTAERATWAFAALAGAFLASAALIRPIGLFLPLPVGIWAFYSARSLGWSRRTQATVVAAFALPWVALVGGWQLRNREAVGAYVASDGPAKFLYLTRAADIVAQKDGIPFATAREEMVHQIEDEERARGVPRERLYLRAALGMIVRHPVLFSKTQVSYLPALMLGTGAAPLETALGTDGADDLVRRGARWALRAAAALHLVLVYAGTAVCFWTARGKRVGSRLAVLLIAALTAYFVVLSTGPQAYSRFRVPFMPLLAVAAGRGLSPPPPRAQVRVAAAPTAAA